MSIVPELPSFRCVDAITSDPWRCPMSHFITSFFLYPETDQPNLHLDDHHEDARWVSTIPNGLDPYVRQCLIGAGLSSVV